LSTHNGTLSMLEGLNLAMHAYSKNSSG